MYYNEINSMYLNELNEQKTKNKKKTKKIHLYDLNKEWDLSSGALLRTFHGHTRWVRSIALGQNRLFSGSWDDTVREWDLETGQCVRIFDGTHELGINAVVVDEEGGRLYSGSDDRTDLNQLQRRIYQLDTLYRKLNQL